MHHFQHLTKHKWQNNHNHENAETGGISVVTFFQREKCGSKIQDLGTFNDWIISCFKFYFSYEMYVEKKSFGM